MNETIINIISVCIAGWILYIITDFGAWIARRLIKRYRQWHWKEHAYNTLYWMIRDSETPVTMDFLRRYTDELEMRHPEDGALSVTDNIE